MTVEARIRHDIEARIHSGEWKPGHRIPFEHELVVTYGCSRATVSKALGGLAKDGLIERRRKAGSFVAHPQVHSAVLEVPDLAQVIAARGEDYRWQLTDRRLAEDGGDVPPPALLVEGVHYGGGEAFALERRLIALATVPDAAQESFADQAPGTWLLHHVWPVPSRQLCAQIATAEVRREGQLPNLEPDERAMVKEAVLNRLKAD